jgi:hypothetical protein
MQSRSNARHLHFITYQLLSSAATAGHGAAPVLALRLAADHLLGTIDRRQKGTLAVRTAARLAQAHSSGIAR